MDIFGFAEFDVEFGGGGIMVNGFLVFQCSGTLVTLKGDVNGIETC